VLIELFSLGVTAEALRAKIDRKSAISLQRGQFDPKFYIKGVAPPIIFARIVRPMNVLQLCHCFHVKKLCSRLSSSEVRFFPENSCFAFFSPPFVANEVTEDMESDDTVLEINLDNPVSTHHGV